MVWVCMSLRLAQLSLSTRYISPNCPQRSVSKPSMSLAAKTAQIRHFFRHKLHRSQVLRGSISRIQAQHISRLNRLRYSLVCIICSLRFKELIESLAKPLGEHERSVVPIPQPLVNNASAQREAAAHPSDRSLQSRSADPQPPNTVNHALSKTIPQGRDRESNTIPLTRSTTDPDSLVFAALDIPQTINYGTMHNSQSTGNIMSAPNHGKAMLLSRQLRC